MPLIPNGNLQPLNLKNIFLVGIKSIGMSCCLALGINTFAATAYLIPSGSMKPTIDINDRLIVSKLTYDFFNPQRGDIVVFNPPEVVLRQERVSADQFIKRIIGLPGDKVEIIAGKVYVNNCLLYEDYITAPPDYRYGPVIVPTNSYLVLGDNRNSSYDSHFWGFVPRNRIIGKAVYRFWPLGRIGKLNQHPLYFCFKPGV